HLERPARRADRVRAALSAHARVHADPARLPRRQAVVAPRRVLPARARAARRRTRRGSLAALLLRRTLRARSPGRGRGSGRLPALAGAAARGTRAARRPARPRRARRAPPALRLPRPRDRARDGG